MVCIAIYYFIAILFATLLVTDFKPPFTSPVEYPRSITVMQ